MPRNPYQRVRKVLSDPYDASASLILSALTVFNVVRANLLPVTHDESRVYREHIRLGLVHIWKTYHESNHTLQSMVSFCATDLFGVSLLSLRLGSLVGGVIYGLACVRLSRVYTRSPLSFVLTLVALTANPIVLDYSVLARGYSLALGFFTAALAVCAIELNSQLTHSEWKQTLLRSLAISCLCGLSVASNLAFAFANTSLLVVFFCWSSIRLLRNSGLQSRWEKAGLNTLALCLPGGVLFLGLDPAILRIRGASLYYGTKSWVEFHGSLLSIMVADPPEALVSLRLAQPSHYLPAALGIFVLLYAALVFVPRLVKSTARPDQAATNWLLVGLILAMTMLLHEIVHDFFGIPLPSDRTGLFFVPLGILLVSSSIEGLRNVAGNLLLRVGQFGLAVLVLYFIAFLRVSYVYTWRFDAGGREVTSLLSTYCREHQINRIGVEWYLTSAMRFYPILDPAIHLPEMVEIFRDIKSSPESLYVLSSRQHYLMGDEHLKVIYEHPVSHVVVAIPPADSGSL